MAAPRRRAVLGVVKVIHRRQGPPLGGGIQHSTGGVPVAVGAVTSKPMGWRMLPERG